MLSVLANTSALSALRLLTATQQNLNQTEGQLSTGLQISDASDNPAYWSIGIGMRAQVAALNATENSIDLSQSIVSTTYAGVNQIIALMQGLQSDVITAAAPGVDGTKVEADVAAKQQEIIDIANSASFDAQNWLVQNKNADITIVEHHQLSDTYSDIQAQSRQYVEYRDDNNPPFEDPTKPFPSGYDFTNQVDYSATAVEMDSAGTKETKAGLLRHGLRSAYTAQGWAFDENNGRYVPTVGYPVVRNAFTPTDPGNWTRPRPPRWRRP